MPLTSRLIIEPLAHEHAEGLVAALSDPSVGAYIGGPEVTTVEAQHQRIDQLAEGPGPERPNESWWNWAVRRRTDGLVLGYIQATGYGEWAEVAYVFGPATSGQGFATEAVRWLMDHLRTVGARAVGDGRSRQRAVGAAVGTRGIHDGARTWPGRRVLRRG